MNNEHIFGKSPLADACVELSKLASSGAKLNDGFYDSNKQPSFKVTFEKSTEFMKDVMKMWGLTEEDFKSGAKSKHAWDWTGDKMSRDGFTVVGLDRTVVVAEYDSFLGASSLPIEDGVAPEWIMPLEKAQELAARISVLDEVFWPGFAPEVVEVVDGAIVLGEPHAFRNAK